MDYRLSEEAAQALIKIYERLALVEVKGDSVEQLFASRLSLKQTIESLKEIEEVKKEE